MKYHLLMHLMFFSNQMGEIEENNFEKKQSSLTFIKRNPFIEKQRSNFTLFLIIS